MGQINLASITDEFTRSSATKQVDATSKTKLLGIRKAAILMLILGENYASEVLRHFDRGDIEKITLELARLKEVGPAEKDEVLKEFFAIMQGRQFISTGGKDFAYSVLERSLGKEKAELLMSRMAEMKHGKPFQRLNEIDPMIISNILQTEGPQTIALLLSYMEAKKASMVLTTLPKSIQVDVAKRMATLQTTTPEIIRNVERVLEKKLEKVESESLSMSGGIETLVDVLNIVDRATEKSILSELEEESPELAEEIKKKLFTFDGIVYLDDAAVQRMLKEVEAMDIAKALKGVDSDVEDKIFRNMSKRAAQMIKEEKEFMGPIRLREVEVAQHKIVSIIRHLEEMGEIIIRRPGDDDIIIA